MNYDCGVLLDVNVLVDGCIEPCPRNPTFNFFNYLEGYPELGLVVEETRKNVVDIIKKKSKNYPKSMEEFYRIETILKTEKVPYSKLQENLKKVEKMFAKIFENRKEGLIHPWEVSRRFRGFARELYNEQIFNDLEKEILQNKLFQKPVEKRRYVNYSGRSLFKGKV